MVSRIVSILFLCLLAIGFQGCNSAPQGTPLPQSGLRLNVKKGDTHRLRMIREEVLKQGGAGSKESLVRQLGVDVTFKVVDVLPDGTATIQVVFNSGTYRQAGELAESDDLPAIFKRDYAKPDNPLGDIQGQRIQIILSNEYALLSLEGMAEQENPGSLAANIGRQYALSARQTRDDPLGDFARNWREGIGEEMAYQICSDLLDLFPHGFADMGRSDDGAIGNPLFLVKPLVNPPDCTWMVEPPRGRFQMARTLARLEPVDDAAEPPSASPIRYRFSGALKGELKVEATTGWIVSGRVEENYSGHKVVLLGKQDYRSPASFRRIVRYEQP